MFLVYFARTCDFIIVCIFFFKQKTAYEMRISDWSSDVCSSDLTWVLDQANRGRLDLGALVTSTVDAGDIESVLIRLAEGDRSGIGVVFDWTDRKSIV